LATCSYRQLSREKEYGWLQATTRHDGASVSDSSLLDITMREYSQLLDIADVTGDGRADLLLELKP
jgi:hypothetical protein